MRFDKFFFQTFFNKLLLLASSCQSESLKEIGRGRERDR
jgi:hypothetical protein